jgi:hypothetical protein
VSYRQTAEDNKEQEAVEVKLRKNGEEAAAEIATKKHTGRS